MQNGGPRRRNPLIRGDVSTAGPVPSGRAAVRGRAIIDSTATPAASVNASVQMGDAADVDPVDCLWRGARPRVDWHSGRRPARWSGCTSACASAGPGPRRRRSSRSPAAARATWPAPPPAPARAPAREGAVARVPELPLERLGERTQRGTEGDPFNALVAEEMRRAAPLPAPPPAPQAPPLPFAFLGKLIDADNVTVFLTRGDRNWVVRSGDTIDGTYRVEAIGDRTMTFTYLALDIRQELGIGAAPTS